MKKTDYNKYNSFAANVADGLDFEYGEGKKMSKTASRLRDAERQRDWLKIQDAELAALTMKHAGLLTETFKSVPFNLNENMKATKFQAKSNIFHALAQDSALAA